MTEVYLLMALACVVCFACGVMAGMKINE